MYSVVPESRVSLDPGLFCKNVIILTLEKAYDLLEAVERGREVIAEQTGESVRIWPLAFRGASLAPLLLCEHLRAGDSSTHAYSLSMF